jgi:hypothetical protein
MTNRRKRQSHQRTVDWSKIVHPSLRVSNHGNYEIKPKMLSGGCILYGHDVFVAYRQRSTQDMR